MLLEHFFYKFRSSFPQDASNLNTGELYLHELPAGQFYTLLQFSRFLLHLKKINDMKLPVRVCLLLLTAACFQKAYSQNPQPPTELVSVRDMAFSGNRVFDSKGLTATLGLPPAGKYEKTKIQLEVSQFDLTPSKIRRFLAAGAFRAFFV